MSFIISTRSELLKTKRSASFWLTMIGAAVLPTILFIVLLADKDAAKNLSNDPWNKFYNVAWQILSVFLLPMFIVLTSTLITQIEFKNNTWKQVYASPQSFANIYFSKFVTIHLLVLCCFIMFNILMLLYATVANLFLPKYSFIHQSPDWQRLVSLNVKTYISVLGISAIQYWLSLRFRNFIVPVTIGLALVIGGIVALNMQWKHIYKYPYSFAVLTYDYLSKKQRPVLENHEWNSIAYFLFFSVAGFLDMKWRKEKG